MSERDVEESEEAEVGDETVHQVGLAEDMVVDNNSILLIHFVPDNWLSDFLCKGDQGWVRGCRLYGNNNTIRQ